MMDRREQLGFLGAFAPSNFGRNDRLDRIAEVLKPYQFEKQLKKLGADGPTKATPPTMLRMVPLLVPGRDGDCCSEQVPVQRCGTAHRTAPGTRTQVTRPAPD